MIRTLRTGLSKSCFVNAIHSGFSRSPQAARFFVAKDIGYRVARRSPTLVPVDKSTRSFDGVRMLSRGYELDLFIDGKLAKTVRYRVVSKVTDTEGSNETRDA